MVFYGITTNHAFRICFVMSYINAKFDNNKKYISHNISEN